MQRVHPLFPAAIASCFLGCGGVTEIPTGDGDPNGGPTGGAGGAVEPAGGAGAGGGATTTTVPPGVCAGADTGLAPHECNPTEPVCNAGTNACLALHEPAGAPVFHLRVASLDIQKPQSLASPVVSGLIESAAAIDFWQCGQGGDGTLSWILSFDTLTGTFTLGTAYPQDDALAPYVLVNSAAPGLDGPIPIAPKSAPFTIDGDCAFATASLDVNLFLFIGEEGLDGAGVLFPLRALRIEGAVSPGHNCIGSYQLSGSGFECYGSYQPGATARALISLAEADSYVITSLNQSLCVLLTGTDATVSIPPGGTKRCAKDANGAVVAKGDACLATGLPATSDCADALFFEANVAAASVTLSP